ncbi:serine protease, subtilase family, partial [Candidatus Thiomargarita nelsonii]
GQTGGTADADIDAVEAWDTFTGSHDVVVAVIDTGVDYNHVDLVDNRWINVGEIAGNGIDDDGNGFVDDVYGYDFVYGDSDPMDGHSHGTHCSGTIGGVGNNSIGVAGVAHTVRIMAVKFLDDSGSGSTDDAIESVLYAVDNGAHILSNSWGGDDFSQGLEDAISYANDHDVLFVAAAGNDGRDTDVSPHYPSSYDVPNVLAVAATDHNDAKPSWSNYGLTSVDLGAPGVDTLSTEPGNSYGYKSGTSMATPHVSGAAALVKGYNPGLSALDIKSLIMDSVDPV